ncbi:MAG: globin [Acidimicrobiales bacterium]
MEQSLYERVGGRDWFDALVARFYAGVESDPVLRPLYSKDLTESREHLAMFLAQYFGGPPHYNEVRGLPRLRMRHARFSIGTPEHDAWLRHMQAAVRAGGLTETDEAAVLNYFVSAAAMLRNEQAAGDPTERPGGSGRALFKLVPPT